MIKIVIMAFFDWLDYLLERSIYEESFGNSGSFIV